MKRLAVLLTLALICAQCSSPKKQEAPAPPGVNILLITVDTLRADHLSCFGYDRKTSPAMDSLARHGVLFSNVFASRGQTWPSLTSILTSQYPRDHGVRENGDMLSPEKVTAPELLRQHGYTTAAFLTNMLRAPNRGFDSKVLRQGQDATVTSAAVRWLKNNGQKKFFVWVHYLAPHHPYSAPPPFDTLFQTHLPLKLLDLTKITVDKRAISSEDLDQVIASYDGEIRYTDSNIEKLLHQLDRLKLSATTMVVLTADHGEELYQHNYYFRHSCSIYDSVLRIPLILKLPHGDYAGKRVDTLAESIDIAPTIFELASLPRPKTFAGQSLVGLIRSKVPIKTSPFAYSEIVDQVSSIQTGLWHFIYNPNHFVPDCDPYNSVDDKRRWGYKIEEEELYDMISDPQEQRNLAKKNPDSCAQLRQQLIRWKSQKKDDYKRPELDEKTKEELKSLGYIQ